MISAGKLCQIAITMEQAHSFIKRCERYEGSYSARLDLLVDLRILRYDIQGALSVMGVEVDIDQQEEK